jgi:betaine-homocysteine S-methyltransferase
MTISTNLLDRLDSGAVIVAEGFLFELERRGYVSAGSYVPEVALEYPEALENLHRDFQRAGSDVALAFTYNGHREKMRVIGKEELLEPLNRAALRIARKVADARVGDMMAGNISNTNIWAPDDPDKQREVRAMFGEMVGWAMEEGADFLVGETFYFAGEAYAALEVMRDADVPVVVTLAPMAGNTMMDGVGIVETCKELEARGADVVGMNCFRGPATMLPYLAEIRAALSCPVAALPVPFRTHEKEPTIFNLSDNNRCTCPSPHGRPFPHRAGSDAVQPLRDSRLRRAGLEHGYPLPGRLLRRRPYPYSRSGRGGGPHPRGQPLFREHAQPLHVRRQRAHPGSYQGAGRAGVRFC